MDQGEIFTLKVKDEYPSPFNTADASIFGMAEDGHAYCLKSQSVHPLLPASELFCSELATLCGLAVPPYRELLTKNGEKVFGSRFEGGVQSADQQFLSKVLFNLIHIQDFQEIYSSILAFDLFIHNTDRHLKNYLFRESFNGIIVALAFDFSRAALVSNWLIQKDLPYNCLITGKPAPTIIIAKELKKHYGFGLNSATLLLDRLSALSASDIEIIINKIPKVWMDDQLKEDTLNWWATKSGDRIELVKSFITGF